MKRWRPLAWFLLSLACFIGAFYFWRLGDRWQAEKKSPGAAAQPASTTPNAASPATPVKLSSSSKQRESTAPYIPPLHPMTNGVVHRSTNFPYRLSNTTQGIGELVHNSKAILLENALIDASKPVNLAIPDKLRAHGDPGSYVVQADGPIDNAFRQRLKAAGLNIVSYIPNNAYLVTGTAAQVAPFGTSVTPWHPYFKIKSALMPLALSGYRVSAVNVAVFPGAVENTKAALSKLGVTVASQSPSPFGTELGLQNIADLSAVANLSGVEVVEPYSPRALLNDLTRVITGVSADVFTNVNFLNLNGSNVLVAVADSWVPTNSGAGFLPSTTINLDLTNIVGPTNIFLTGFGIEDLAGHATHVGGIIAASGNHSPTNVVPGSPQFSNYRGKAPLSTLFALPLGDISDAQLQEMAAQTNALISNNSWGYGSTFYDLAAASYDQAVRDSIPGQTSSQSLIYVFAAGNGGGGDASSGLGGSADTLSSPGVAKNVITVGASELPRNITNETFVCDTCIPTNGCGTNQPWLAETSSSNLVADFSSRGNVGINVEGEFGRFKPDVIAPGTMVVSTRSLTWDKTAYDNPVTHNFVEFDGNTVDTNTIFLFPEFFIPCSSTEFDVRVQPFPTNLALPVYVNPITPPTTTTFLLKQTNAASLPPDAPLNPVDEFWFVGVGNPTNVPVVFNFTADVTTTNELGNFFDVLQTNLNDPLLSSNDGGGPFYRFETGTSMAAPAVSGVLALMEDYFTNQLQTIPSPALMKALLINGARSINAQYDFEVQNNINYQGWGLVNLTNSLAGGPTNAWLTSSFGKAAQMVYVDQSTTNALATGDSLTYTINVNSNAQSGFLRFTLVWTDPPGNPAASLKLVNNLELVVTNTSDPTNPIVFFGNDFPAGSSFTEQWDGDTNNIPYDTVNNVQNVYLPLPLGTNYTVTVFAKDVNVNAVTANSNSIVQDFALVISSDNPDGEVTNALTFASASAPSIIPRYMPDVAELTNQFAGSATAAGAFLDHQLVGANPPLQGTNTLGLTNQNNWATNGQITAGLPNQWHFYVITNTSGSNAAVRFFTNALFATFNPHDLSIPPVGVNAPNITDATRPEADIDLYVSRLSATNPTPWDLTNLNPAVLAVCDKSLSRGGTEALVYSNAQQDEVFYIGVKSEDQEAAEYEFIALFTLAPFNNGNNNFDFYPVPNAIPSGTPLKPGVAQLFTFVGESVQIQRAVMTNHMEHENFGDLIGTLKGPGGISVVLNNHTFGDGTSNQVLIYEDNGQGDIAGSRTSDGPGSLRSFIGKPAAGLWSLTVSNTGLFFTGQVDNATLHIDPEGLGDGGNGSNDVVFMVQPLTFHYEAIDVPGDATNLTLCVTYDASETSPQTVDLFVRFGHDPATDLPTQTSFDYMQVINPPGGGCLSIGQTSLPPLKPGTYFIGVYNPNPILPQTVHLTATIGRNVNGVNPVILVSTNVPISIVEDAVTNSLITTNQFKSTNQSPNQIFVADDQTIASVNVGVVLKDPLASDLALTLISPTGQRILLFENRGAFTTNSMGHLNISTNFFGQVSSGGAIQTNNILTNIPPQGVLLITYEFFDVPDQMDVYDSLGQHIFHSGFVSHGGTFTIPYGPGVTFLNIIMNQGNNPVDTTAWRYTPQIVSEDFTYLTFTDNTNLTQIPIKFAIPPYDNLDNGTNFTLSDFEFPTTNGDYIATGLPVIIPDPNGSWTLATNNVFVRSNFFAGTNMINLSTNFVSIVSDPNTAGSGTNYLALANGSISRVISVAPQRNYTISYRFRGPGVAGWWRGEGNGSDSSDPELLANNGSLIGRFNFPAGEVGQAFAMEDSGLAFQFAGTNTYVQVRQSPTLDVGSNGSGFTVEGWIDPTNTSFQQPIVEWLARVPTNTIVNGRPVTNLVIEAGPFLNRLNGHYYYLLGQTNWRTSELWANSLGGHLVEVDDANEENFIYDTFAQFGLTNHTMWIGLTNSASHPAFIWSTGNPLTYTDWGLGQPTNCGGAPGFTAILGPTNALPGLWAVLNNNGVDCAGVSNAPFGIVEVDNIQTNGVQLWISVTNSLTNNVLTGNGRLYANIMDTNNVPHEIFSAPGLIQTNVFQHVALTYNTNTGVAQLFLNGTNVATTNVGIFVPNTGGDVLLGKDMSRVTNNFFWGLMDEMSIYSRYLSDAEIAAIYNISASTTNRNIGKFDPGITPALSLAEAQAVFGGVTNLLYGGNQSWQVEGFTFKAQSNTLPVQITGLEPGVLLDSFFVSEQSPGNLYYLPEQPLSALVGSNAFGLWTLEVRDARTGLPDPNAQLTSWELQFVLVTNTPAPIQVTPQQPFTNAIPPGETGYYVVNVPGWANAATNILVSSKDSSNNPALVSMLFNQNFPPLTGNPGDFLFVNNLSTGSATITTNPPSVPPLSPGRSYYLAVTNPGPAVATVVVEVDYNMTTLTNGVPYLASFNTNDIERPFIFNVSSNATEATFQVMQMKGGNADLVLRRGLPLPSLTSEDYGAFNGTNASETIYVLTNSLPVAVSPGPWYLDVIKRITPSDTGATGLAMRYAVLAKELDGSNAPPNIINISNRVPFKFTAGPGAALTNFFRFTTNNFSGVVASNISGIHFELYNQSGDGDLTVQTNAPPLSPAFYHSSQQPSANAEFIFMHTNSALTNLIQDYYLGVPNNETNTITYTILGVIETNVFASFPSAEGAGSLTRGGAFGTNVYHVTTLADSGAGSLRAAVTATNGGGTVVFDTSGTINLATPLFITNSGFTIAGQTAPGTNGITIAGGPTYVQDVTDIILRYVRFRPTDSNILDSLQFTNAQNIIADHVSVAFGASNVVSILNSSNVTVQWSVLADSLNTSNVVVGGSSIRFGTGDVTLHHNLYADNYSGNPTIGEDVTLDFVNNVIYNWGLFAGNSTNDPAGVTNFLNYSANYLIAGTNSFPTNGAFFGSSTNTYIFQTNNFIDTNLNLVLDGANTSWGMFSNQFTQFSAPFGIEPTAPDEAFIAYERVLDFAGASMDKRDLMDVGQVQQVRLYGGTNAAGPALLSGMISWWKGESNTVDSAGPNSGTWAGFGTINSYVPGEVGKAFSFDGTHRDRVDLGNPASLQLQNFTIEAWVKRASASVISLDENFADGSFAGPGGFILGYGAGGYCFGLFDTGEMFVGQDSGPAGSALITVPLVTDTNWHHLAVTRNGTAVLFYMDGVQRSPTSAAPYTTVYSFTTSIAIGSRGDAGGNTIFGAVDELSVYSRVLTPCEISAIFSSGTAGKQPLLTPSGPSGSTALPFADVDKDGVPDFWEITLGENVTNFSANADRDGDGYTDLEEYLNWLGAPHALTITNMTTNVDLYVMSGKTGNLTFGVQNGTNGTVYLTNGPACSEDPATSQFIAVFTPTNTLPFGTNGGFASFSYMVTNMDTFAYFGPVSVGVFVSSVPITNQSVFSFPAPPDIRMNPNTNLTVTNIAIPTNGVTYQPINPPPFETIDTNTGVITFSPTNGPSTNIITTVATDTNVPPNSLTNTFILIVNGPPVFILQPPPNITNAALGTVTVTNAATDPDMPPSELFYQLISPPTPLSATIGTNTGIITWTPTLADLGSNLFETVVTDTNGLSATNFFVVFVTAPIAPYAFTQPAQGMTGTAARFNGMATPNGIPSVAWFDYGTNTTYGLTTPQVGVGSGNTVVYVLAAAISLVPNVPYHYRLTVSNAFAVTHGFDQILDEANLVVWGANFLKQSQPPVGLGATVTEIAGAYDHSLAVLNTRAVTAWGDNTFNQVNVPLGLANVFAVAGGQYSSMALRNTRTVTAWGANVFPNVTNVPASITNVIMLAAGADAGVVLDTTGNVKAWGANFSGLTNVPATLRSNNVIVEVAAGDLHGLAIKNDGTVLAWGQNNAGQSTVPAGLSNVVQVSGGNFHSLALKSDGTVVAWGDDSAGQTNVPPGLSNVVAIAAGGFHSLALKDDGTLVGWGDNSAGEITFPIGLSNVVAIAAGHLHSLALTPLQLVGGTNTTIVPSTNGVLQVNTVLPGQTLFYQVNVPGNADFSTNSLFAISGGNLNMWFTTNTPPTITNASDFELLTNLPSGSVTLTTSGTPHFTPATTYYLGVQNTNAFSITYGVEVDFHFATTTTISTNTAPISIIHTNMNGTNGFLLIWYAPSNDLFEVQWESNLFPTAWNTFTNPNPVTYNVAKYTNNPNSAEFEFFDDGSQTGGFGPWRFYQILLLNGAAGPSVLSPGVAQTNGISGGSTTFYQITVPTNAVAATNLLSTLTGNLNLWFSTNAPPSVGAASDFHLLTNTTGGSFVLNTNSSTPRLNDGTVYYLGVQNTNAGSVVYSIAVNFAFVTSTNGPATNTVPISSIVKTNILGTPGYLLTWFAPSNDIFQVQWSSNLPPAWTTFSTNIALDVTYTNINFSNTMFDFFDDGSLSGGLSPNRFYRLILMNGASSSAVVPLVNGVPMPFSTAAGKTNFFSFDVTQTNAAVLFELYNLTGNGLMNLQLSNLPVSSPYFATSSVAPSTSYQQIVLRTNLSLPNLNAVSWFLGVTNATAGSISYTIRAVVQTNGILVSGVPIGTTVSQSGGTNIQLAWNPAVNGEKYEVRTNSNLASTNWGALATNTASGTSLTFTNSIPAGSLPALFYWVVQVP